MQPLSSPPDVPRIRIGRDGQTAEVRAGGDGAVLAFETRADGRRRGWLAADGLGVRAVLPAVSTRPCAGEAVRVSRDQVEFQTVLADARGAVALTASQLVTVDDWGLHLALAVENHQAQAVPARMGFALSLALGADGAIELPPGALGGGSERRSTASPFAWPRRTVLRLADGDTLDVLGFSPLSRTEVRRAGGGVELRVLSPGTLSCGQTVRMECRLRTHLAGG